MTYFIDANIFIRYFVKDNPIMYKDCLSFLTRVKKENIPIYTAYITISEIYWVLLKVYGVQGSEIITMLRSLSSIPSLQFTENFNLPLALDFATSYNVKFIDCLLASHKDIQAGIMTMVSYDTDFDKLKIKRIEPK